MVHKPFVIVVWLPLLGASALGCNSLTEEGAAGCETATSSQRKHGADMMPGRACFECHDEFTAAGTVYASADAPCNHGGVAGVSVEILTSDGHTGVTLETNGAGNFFTTAQLPNPYRVRITSTDGTTATMLEPQTNGSCAHCHRKPGAFGASGLVNFSPSEAPPDAGTAEED